MNIILFSDDQVLASFCREILIETFGASSKLEVTTPGKLVSARDVCLWDFVPGQSVIPQAVDPANWRYCLFLADRKHLSALEKFVGTSEIHVLLKPIVPAALRAFLAHQLWTHREVGAEDHIDKLRVDRDEMLQFLMQANLKLQEYDQDRTNFLGRSIHDFRAPLTAISGYCGLLLEAELGPLTPDQREIIGRMHRSAARLSDITNSMFQLSIPHNVAQNINLEHGDMRECADQALHEVGLLLEDKRISVRVEIEASPDGLLFDRSQIEQTLVNLLENACKFTPRNGTIDVRGYPFFWDRKNSQTAAIDSSMDRRNDPTRTPNSFRIDVQDSGPGIPAMHAAKIFEEYTSYSGGQDRSGSGLGLAICRRILQLHHGCVWAESHSAGAVFSFVLPVQPLGTCTPVGQKPSLLVGLSGREES